VDLGRPACALAGQLLRRIEQFGWEHRDDRRIMLDANLDQHREKQQCQGKYVCLEDAADTRCGAVNTAALDMRPLRERKIGKSLQSCVQGVQGVQVGDRL
jgi:hypothetical protein